MKKEAWTNIEKHRKETGLVEVGISNWIQWRGAYIVLEAKPENISYGHVKACNCVGTVYKMRTGEFYRTLTPSEFKHCFPSITSRG